MQLSESHGLRALCYSAHGVQSRGLRHRRAIKMSHSKSFCPHEVITLSVSGYLFTVPLATLQGPAARGSVLEQIAEQYARRSDAPGLADTHTFDGTSQASTSITATTPGMQNFDTVVVPGSNQMKYCFQQILSCLQRMDSGLDIIRPADIIVLSARELKISSLATLLTQMQSVAPDATALMSPCIGLCYDTNNEQLMGLLQQMNLQMSTLINLQQQTLQTLQQQHGASGSLQRRLEDLEDRMTAAMQPPQP